MSAVELLWPDGSITRAATFVEAERKVRSAQWRPFKSRREFRREMSKRAAAWSGESIAIGGSARTFLYRLAGRGMFMIVQEKELPSLQNRGTINTSSTTEER
jgi:hypothetical protein